ncbi:MAG: Eco57I restriction-modification methylase domain-containing protein [Chthonomonas sp.]|nr:Eco57I restriction-modification methylase domain-containing protein [Chthonomonas sp.]
MVDASRIEASGKLDPDGRSSFGQFLTPLPTARLMASMIGPMGESIRILDPGSGIGTLFTSAVEELVLRPDPPRAIHVVAYEVDVDLLSFLKRTIFLCESFCASRGIDFKAEVRACDFIADTADRLRGGLFDCAEKPNFDLVIQNPPYRKIAANSDARRLAASFGPEVVNLYAAFLAASVRVLKEGGELVSITPRSFCNGPYFKPFRHFFLERMRLERFHLFGSRNKAFQEDSVLQETIITHAVRTDSPNCYAVQIASSECAEGDVLRRFAPFNEVVRPGDRQAFFHLAADELEARTASRAATLTSSLGELGISVSTGRVVDFRVKDHLRAEPEEGAIPLIYPANLSDGRVTWPKAIRKPQAVVLADDTRSQTLEKGHYVLVKRFSSKEEKRRVTAAIVSPESVDSERIAFENHLNFFHENGHGLDETIAKGLALFLNSSQVDDHFRQFNGHTQVNATDLRSLRYPTREELSRLGNHVNGAWPDQAEIDRIFDEELMADETEQNPQDAKRRIDEAIQILTDLGMPRAQINERSALTLLALVNLTPDKSWDEAASTPIGITPMMDFMKTAYGKDYAPNTRETVRRHTVHQFVQAAFILENPDDPARPTNSPKTVYVIESSALALLQQFGSEKWPELAKQYLTAVPALQTKYQQARERQRIPIELPKGVTLTLSPGGQNELVVRILEDFAPIFTPGGRPIYVGDTDDKNAFYDKDALAHLGVEIESHGKMPDVIIHHTGQDWLVLIEAVTSHGPINPKRLEELKELFKGCKIGLVYVTTFLTRDAMKKYLSEIAWETEVWAADTPEHLIHFNGERFLGPY